MNRNGHIKLGLIVFTIYVVALTQLRPIGVEIMIISGLTSILGSLLPDIIEPSSDFRHRGFGHSKRILGYSALAFLISTFVAIIFPSVLIMSAIFLGYMIHLIGDSTTEVGIPE